MTVAVFVVLVLIIALAAIYHPGVPMTIYDHCPGCGQELGGLGRFCTDCDEYTDVLAGEREAPVKEQADAMPKLSEEQIRQTITADLEKLGFTVWKLEQGYRPFKCKHCGGKIPGGSRQTLGLADLFVTGRGVHFFVETKRADPKHEQTAHQKIFESACDDGGCTVYVWRSPDDAASWYQRTFKKGAKA